MKRFIPLLITALGGFVLIVAFFIPAWQESGEVVAVWFDILASIAFLLGGGNLLKVHLKSMSDRKPGWGYSGVTLLAFLATLFVGLFKIGVAPAENSEKYGESFVPLALAEMPEVSTPGVIPTRADGEVLPASVRRQLREDAGQVYFRGWMTAAQFNDLIDWQDTLLWRALVEELQELASPPGAFGGKLGYDAEHEQLSWKGWMTDADRTALGTVFPDWTAPLDDLQQRATVETTIADAGFPKGFAIPDPQAIQVVRDGETLRVRGPMTAATRAALVDVWANAPRLRPMSTADQQRFIDELVAAGGPLSPNEPAVIHRFIHTIWTSPLLVQALNSAGTAQPGEKSWRELRKEQLAGVDPLVREIPAGDSSELNDAQVAAVEAFAADSTMSVDDLGAQLVAGDFTINQVAALQEFLASQPTVADFRKQIALALLSLAKREGRTVPQARIDILLAEHRAQAAFETKVNELYRASHVTRFPLSGDYKATGSPFWWVYEYLFQPLTATMFALLAFYVASAAFRAFRAKNTEAILLLGTAFIILVVQTPLGAWLTGWVPDSLSALQADEMKRYIMSLFNTAGNRAIMIGIALGTAATSLQILLGVDRSYLGRGDD
jgi:hypothetical protein